MKLWEEFHPRVMPYVIGCPTPLVNQALIDAAREFCLNSKAWQETEEFPAFTGFDAYDFDKPNGSEVIQVIEAKVDGKGLNLESASRVPQYTDSVRERDSTLYRLNEDQYLILPQPAEGQTISITLALRPTENGTGVGDNVFAKHVAAIAAGARSILQRMPRQLWSDMAQAQIDRTQFERGMNWAAENAEFMQVSAVNRRVKSWG